MDDAADGDRWTAGRAAWPALAVERADLDAYLAARPDARAPAADLYLACACVRGTPGAAATFTHRYLDRVERYLGTLVRTVDVDEVRQELALRLLVGAGGGPGRIADYAGHGSLEGWVRIAAARTAVDLLRRGAREVPDDELDQVLADGALTDDAELEAIKQRYASHFRDGVRAAVRDSPPEVRALLRLHYLQGVTTAALAALYHVSRATIVRRLTDARTAVLEGTAAHVREQLGMSSGEYQSLLELIRSRIEITVERLMAGD